MVEHKLGKRTETEKAAFLQAIDVLLPAIEKGGWAQFTDSNTRIWINLLAKYAYLFGFPEPPFVIRTITKQGEPEINWRCGGYGPSCHEVETVTVNGPYTKEIVGPVELGADCCQPWHCKAFFALKEWREEVAAIEIVSAVAAPPTNPVPEKPIDPPKPHVNENHDSFDGYKSADRLWHDHGIKAARLSEAKKAGKVRWKPAPCGITDSQCKSIRIVYNVADALKHCLPKHVKEKTRQNPLGNL